MIIVLKFAVFFLLFVLLLAGVAFWLAANKIKWLERRCSDLWKERGKLSNQLRLKGIEVDQLKKELEK